MSTYINRRQFIKSIGLGAGVFMMGGCADQIHPQASLEAVTMSSKKPNFIIIFCDDMGYGDLSCFGHPTIRTPNLDEMAAEGQKWTNFYVGASVCTPSRAALLTGRLPIRSGMCDNNRRVLFPDSAGGLPQREVTIAEALKTKGYATACVGKWHLGSLPQYLPTNNGFDSYFGIPYSNDMDRIAGEGRKALLKSKDKPFFLYLAHNLPHVPLFVSQKFKGRSLRGLYGDVVEEIDSGVGQILQTLRREGLAENTFVVFTSDNGPWLIFNEHGGSAGLLRGGKGCTFEGGMREPCIMWWPGKIKPDLVNDMGATMDLYTTILTLAGAKVPEDRVVDGLDLSPALFGTGPSPRRTMFYYRGVKLYAVRKGPYKAHFITKPAYGSGPEKMHDPPLLYHLGHDPSEKYDISKDHPEVIQDIRKEVAMHLANLTPGEDQLAKRIEKKG
jgi:arylsulfatase A